eukprot:1161558-Pelagomonas_calceolata.AAC.13
MCLPPFLQLANAEKEKAEAEAGAVKARTEFGTFRAEAARLKGCVQDWVPGKTYMHCPPCHPA